jgi:chemotaxis protein CheD
MKKPDGVIEVFLQPGEYFFGDHETRLRTVLGSCVSITFWHPTKLIGGMCHIMLPERSEAKHSKVHALDGKYADEALTLIMQEINNAGTHPREYQVKLFGGGDMFSISKYTDAQKVHIGEKNIVAAEALLKQNGFLLQAKNLGGVGHRSIIFDIWSGYVWVKHSSTL